MPNTNPYTNPFNREYILAHAPYLSVISDEDWHNACDTDMSVADEDQYPAEAWSNPHHVSPYVIIPADAERGLFVFRLASVTKVPRGDHDEYVGLYVHHDSIWTPEFTAACERYKVLRKLARPSAE